MNDVIKRILAALIDFYIICFLASALAGVFTLVANVFILGKIDVTTFAIIMYLIMFFVLLLFKDFALKNASIGKRIFKLKVVKTDGTKLKFADIIKRTIPTLPLSALETFLLIFNDNRRLGDIWAKTSVVYNDNQKKN